jgi:hypothetical protein
MIDVMSPPEQQDQARASMEWRALRDLAPHLWPPHNIGARLRVVLALALLAAAKAATVYVPILLKKLVDLFADPANLPVVVPLGLVVGYGLLLQVAVWWALFRIVGRRSGRDETDRPPTGRPLTAVTPVTPVPAGR